MEEWKSLRGLTEKVVNRNYNFPQTVLVVGFGSIGKRHAQIIRELFPEIRLVVLRHKKSIGSIDQLKYVDHVVYSISEAIDLKPDFAIIANPAPFHLSVSVPLVKAGIHLLIEKPLSTNCEGIDQLVKLCKEKQVLVMIGYHLRFLPSIKFFQKELTNLTIGKIYSVHATVGQNLVTWRPGIDYRKSVSAQKKLGGGVLLELSHELDYLTMLFGKFQWTSAYISHKSELDIDVEDSAHIVFKIENKITNKPLIGTLNLDFIRHDTVRQCTVIGENGSLKWNGITGTVKLLLENNQKWKELFSGEFNRNYAYKEALKHFLDCMRDGKETINSVKNSIHILETIEAIQISSKNECRQIVI